MFKNTKCVICIILEFKMGGGGGRGGGRVFQLLLHSLFLLRDKGKVKLEWELLKSKLNVARCESVALAVKSTLATSVRNFIL